MEPRSNANGTDVLVLLWIKYRFWGHYLCETLASQVTLNQQPGSILGFSCLSEQRKPSHMLLQKSSKSSLLLAQLSRSLQKLVTAMSQHQHNKTILSDDPIWTVSIYTIIV